MKYRFFLCLLSGLLLAGTAHGHGGAVDAHGGHVDRKTGEYHCHREPCFSAQKQVIDATRKAEAEGREFSLIYNRSDWPHWSDLNGDCQDSRDETLMAGASKLSANGCDVRAGSWICPFSGDVFTDPGDLDIDHIIPLKWAHAHGGANWTRKQKKRFANDPDNLLAVTARLNRQKGSRGPTEWLPPRHEYRCEYLGLWRELLDKYPDLQIASAEKRTFQRQLAACG